MEYTTLAASKPGQPAPKFEKRTKDIRVFLVNCTDILTKNELLLSNIELVNNNKLITVADIRPKQGKYIQFRVAGGPEGITSADYTVQFIVKTSAQNVIEVPILIKAYSN